MAADESIASKHCSKCGTLKPISEFCKDRQKSDGLASQCGPCRKLKNKEWAFRNPDRLKAANARWRERNAAAMPALRRASYLRAYEQNRADDKAYYELNRLHILRRSRERYRETIEYQRTRKIAWRLANRAKIIAASAAYRAAHREAQNEGSCRWAKRNKDRHNAHRAKRRASELRATPSWASSEAMIAIFKQAVDLSASTGSVHHVDHIVPLQHKLVCGLHCEANLRVLDALMNRKKGNRHWPDMP